MHGCDPGRVSDDSRLALYQTRSIECPSSIFFLAGVFCYCSFLLVVSVSFRYVFFCSRWSFVDVPLIFFCPADPVPDWQPHILLGMVEARSVNVKKTTTVYPSPYSCMVRWYYYRHQYYPLNYEICTTQIVFMFCYDWWRCMVINISVQYNGGFLPDIILLTQGYYHWGTRLNTV